MVSPLDDEDVKAAVDGKASLSLSAIVRDWLTAESATSEPDTTVEKLEDGKVATGIFI